MRKQYMPAVFAGIGLLILILDTKTALSGAAEGIDICLKTLIPSLFPFLFLSGFLTSSLQGKTIRILKPIGKLLRIPQGAESIFLIGLLGGYPVGAQCTAQAVKNGSISRENGKRMLAFCSNAGPAFLFGVGSRLFSEIWMCWALWGIHIISALLVGFLIPEGHTKPAKLTAKITPDPSSALRQSLRTMAMVCGWVVLFRVLLAFCQRWFLWLLPVWGQLLFSGLLELANGCCSLAQIEPVGLRFLLCSAFLGFGGLCVTMQTFGVCSDMDCAWYLPGKLLQTVLSSLMACMVISREMAFPCGVTVAALIGGILFFQRRTAKKDSNLGECVV